MSDVTYRLESRVTKRRSVGSDREFRLLADDRVVMIGNSAGRLLAAPAEFRHSDGRPAFSIVATRRWLPRVWLAANDEGPIVRFRLSAGGRGATGVEDLQTGSTYQFRPDSGLLSDMAKAAILLHTDTFLLFDGERLLATTGEVERSAFGSTAPAEPTSGSAGSSRFHHAATLRALDGWSPTPSLAAAMLIFKDQVVDFVRSP